MSASQYRSQLVRKRQQHSDATKKASDARTKESKKRSEAAKARQAAAKASSPATARTRLREADRKENEAETAGKEANRWQDKVNALSKEITALDAKVTRAEQSEAAAADRKRSRQEQQAAHRSALEHAELERRVADAESIAHQALRQLPEPRTEKLRILLLGASSDGELRVGREQKRIQRAVESALHRDRIAFDVRGAATTEDLLDGITRFRPHIVHFSGHSDAALIEFERDVDPAHDGMVVTAGAFARALKATDEPPLLVLLNSCNSAPQAADLVKDTVPFAIGMSEEIEDGDAINYAARFYTSLANGQSIQSAHAAGVVALEFTGLVGESLPQLASAEDVDAGAAVLVRAD